MKGDVPLDIAKELEDLLKKGGLKSLRFAETLGTPPPQLAYLVNFPRLMLTLKGHDSMWIEQAGRSSTLTLRAGEGLFIPPNCWNQPTWNSRTTTLSLLFGAKQLGLSLISHDGSEGGPSLAQKATLPMVVDDSLRHMVSALLCLKSSRSRSALPLANALLFGCVDALNAPLSSAKDKGRSASLYESVCMYVQEHFQFSITRESVADHFHLSPGHVSRLFAGTGQVHFNDYVTYVRINRAKHLLKSYWQSVEEVSTACGFTDSSYFCRVFKKKTGVTPLAYRQLQAKALREATHSK